MAFQPIRGGRVYIELSLAIALSLTGCLYGLRGGGGFPPDLRTVFVAPLDNKTDQFDLDQLVFTQLTDKLPRSLGLRLAGEQAADAIVRGSITRYDDVAQNYQPGQQGSVNVLQHQVSITVSIQLIDVKKNEIIWESTSLTGRGEYRPDSQSKDVARQQALESLIQQIIDGAQSTW